MRSGSNLYSAPYKVLDEQARRTLADLRADSALTASVYDPLGWDVVAFQQALEQRIAIAADAALVQSDAQEAAYLAWARLKEAAFGPAQRWLKRFRQRLRTVTSRTPKPVGLYLPLKRARYDRVDHIVLQVRALRPELPRVAPTLLEGPHDGLIAEGVALAETLDALDATATQANQAAEEATRAFTTAEKQLVAALRLLAGWAGEAVRAEAEVVPGLARDVLAQWAATRPPTAPRVRSRDSRAGLGELQTGPGDSQAGVGELPAGLSENKAGLDDPQPGRSDARPGPSDSWTGLSDPHTGLSDPQAGLLSRT